MNVFTFSGNLGGDAEVKYMPSGDAVANFSVAVKSGYGDKEKTNWVRCALFGKRAEGGLIQYLKKGTQVVVSGELSLEEWEGQNGKGAALSVRVNDVTLAGGNSQQSQSQHQSEPQPQSYGSFGDPWSGLQPAGEPKQNGATLEQIKNHPDIKGDAGKAKAWGWVV